MAVTVRRKTEFHLRFRSTSFFQFASTCAARTETETTEVSTALPQVTVRQTQREEVYLTAGVSV